MSDFRESIKQHFSEIEQEYGDQLDEISVLAGMIDVKMEVSHTSYYMRIHLTTKTYETVLYIYFHQHEIVMSLTSSVILFKNTVFKSQKFDGILTQIRDILVILTSQ